MKQVSVDRWVSFTTLLAMWVIKLDNKVWVSESGTTTNEADAKLFPDMPSVQDHLKKIRLYTPYKEAMVVYDNPEPTGKG